MRRYLLLLALLLVGAGTVHAEGESGPTRVGLIRLRDDGAYRITREQWRGLGISDPLRLEVRRSGKALTTFVGAEAGLADGAIGFAATRTASAHSAFAVYELWQQPKARPPRQAPPSPGVPLPRAITTDRLWGPLPAAEPAIYDRAMPHWFLGLAPRGQAATIQLGPLGAAPGSAQILEVDIRGAWSDLAILEARWGEVALGRAATADASGGATLQWTLAPGAVPAAPAALVLRNVSPTPSAPPRHDVSEGRGTLAIDAVRLVGRGSRLMRWPDARPVTIQAAGPPADPLARAGHARHVIVATPPLLSGARRLAAHRSAHGLPSVAIAVTDIYDRYGFAERHPAAVRAFVRDLQQREQAPLEFLVLAGDATFDRTDIGKAVTIPAPMVRTMYNGATAADVLYAGDSATEGATAIGRLPFASEAVMDAYVARLIRYEDNTPLDPSRRLLRFITSPGRFGPFIDGIIESRFRRVLANSIPPAYDVAITFAHPRSPYLWPPTEFNAHVLKSINAGALYAIYVGHGFAQGFDTLRVGGRRFPILHVRDAPQVAIRGTAPVMFVLACTTAMFDGTSGPGIGEALLRQPAGPIAYWGATRVCHPGFNALMGESIAGTLARKSAERPRLGDLLAVARKEALDPLNRKIVRAAIRAFSGGPTTQRIASEGALMYALLGDPALRVAVPRASLTLQATPDVAAGSLEVTVGGQFPVGTRIAVALEWPRSHKVAPRHQGLNAADPTAYPQIRENHTAANALGLAQAEGVATTHGSLTVQLKVPAGQALPGLVVKAHAVFAGDVHSGALRLP